MDERLLKTLAFLDDRLRDEIDHMEACPDESLGFIRNGTYFVLRKEDLEYTLELAKKYVASQAQTH